MRYFVGFLIAVGLLILLVVLLLTGGGGKNPRITGEKPHTSSELAAFSKTGAVVRMTVDGETNADQLHTVLRITVGSDDVVYEQIQGYEGTVVNQRTFANNENAYNNFLYALGRSGFTRGNDDPKLANEKGYCPLGHRYIFELMDGSRDIERYWATNCGSGVPKTYEGSLSLTQELFQQQVPGYLNLIENISNF